MTVDAEFATVDAVVASGAETLAVDAFALSLIKAERQMRRLFTHLVFQSPAFTLSDIGGLRDALADNRHVYLEGFIRGWDALYPRSIRELVGAPYERLLQRMTEATEHRNKIFHGQLTSKWLSREELLSYAEDIRSWCRTLAVGAQAEIAYDGFGRDSLRKSGNPDVAKRLCKRLDSVSDYRSFIEEHLQRPRK